MAKSKKNSGVDFSKLNNPSQTLFANIGFCGIDKPIKSIAITSSGANEGKTATAMSLAFTVGASGKRVLIVDTDMRRRSLAGELDCHPAAGMYAVLTGQTNINNAIAETKYPNVFFMDAEPGVPNPPEVLASKRFSALAKTLRDSFDFVIFDTPPVGVFVDAAVIGKNVDGVVLVIRQNQSKRKAVAESIAQLQQANANVLGTILTFAERGNSDYYYYAYYTEDDKRVRGKAKEEAEAAMRQAAAVVSEENLDEGDLSQWADEVGVPVSAVSSHGAQATAVAAKPAAAKPAAAKHNSVPLKKEAPAQTASSYPTISVNQNSQPLGNKGNAASDPFAPGAFKQANPYSRSDKSRYSSKHKH